MSPGSDVGRRSTRDAMVRAMRTIARPLPWLAGVLAACSAGGTPAAQDGTWQVDCVAVLGTPTISNQMPLGGVHIRVCRVTSALAS
jgi:hypothetical protein